MSGGTFYGLTAFLVVALACVVFVAGVSWATRHRPLWGTIRYDRVDQQDDVVQQLQERIGTPPKL